MPNAAILIAATAHSTPLFPSFPPDLSIDCCFVLSVKTQKITGTSYLMFKSIIP